MAKPTRALIAALDQVIARLQDGANYQWGHMGSCNCGHLAQALTHLPRQQIHAAALRRAGDWGEQAVEYCAVSGFPLDHIITTMLNAGLELHDIDRLERLADPEVLRRLPMSERWLKRNRREDAITYMRAWRELLCEQYNALHPQAPYAALQVIGLDDDVSDAQRVA